MSDTARRTRRSSPRRPKDVQGKAPYPHDARTTVEELAVWLRNLEHYCSDELTGPERHFVHVVGRNLAKIHRRLARAPGS